MKSRIFTLLVAFLVTLSGAARGQGTTISISNAAGLKDFAERVNDGETDLNAVLTADIDLGGNETNQWTPIGARLNSYEGTFDGGNFTISGLYIYKEADEIEGLNYDFGLFGFVRDAEIKNISVEGKISAAGAVGGICGTAVETKIKNCHSSVNIKVTEMYQQPQTSNYLIMAGGICGLNNANMSECTFDGTIAVNFSTTIKDWMLPQFAVGGICGVHSSDVVNNCYNEGTIELEGNVDNWGFCLGGICGMLSGATIESCYNKGEINAEKYTTGTDGFLYVGGIVGSNNALSFLGGGEIRYCYNVGDIKTAESKSEYDAFGTICGQNDYMYQGAGTIENCYYLPQSSFPSIGASGESTGTNVESKDETAFQNGEVAYLLCEYGYGQNLQNESITSPTLLAFTPNTEVYKLTLNYGDVDSEKEEEEKYVNSGYLGLPELTAEEEGKRIGWFDASGTEYTSESEITEDISLTAKVVDQTEEPTDPDEGDEDDDNDNPGDIHHPQRPIKYYNIYVDTVCPGLDVEVSKNVVREGHQVSAYLTIQAECDTTGMRFEYKRSLFGYWQDLKELEGVQPGEYIIKNIYTDIYIRALDATLPEEEPTGIEDVEGVKAYAKEGRIYVYTPNCEEVTIISMGGAILKHAEQIGLQSYRVIRGIYIVRVGEKVFKLKN